MDVAGLQARELEQVVDQPTERAYVRGHQPQLVAHPLGLEDPVLQPFGDQLERGDRRAQVVRDRRHQFATSALLGRELDRHRLDIGGEQ